MRCSKLSETMVRRPLFVGIRRREWPVESQRAGLGPTLPRLRELPHLGGRAHSRVTLEAENVGVPLMESPDEFSELAHIVNEQRRLSSLR